MIKIFVNNRPVFVPRNTSVLEACESIDVFIPRFCYHERLNVAGNCRMCLVEIEKAPKPLASCAFPVAPNMKIYTDTPMVRKARENVLEFLLANHPLDCPICDQGGECDLQEQTMAFGSDRSRFFYSKRAVEDKNCGPLVRTIMTRCIHCTRCVRFFQDIAGQEDFGTTLRGQDTEIGTYVGKILNSELSGNIIDLCPVGALTSKPYAFTARPWEIKSTQTIDILDSLGSNIRVDFKETEVLRVLPALNDTLNEEWISDKTRFSFDGLKNQRIDSPYLFDGTLKKTNWRNSFKIFHFELQKALKENPESVLFLCGDTIDLETLENLKKTSQTFGVLLTTESDLNVESDLMLSIKSNTTLENILESDLCLSVGTNPRFEASLLNVRLKKRIRKGEFIKASIGLRDDLTYSNDSIGASIKTLIEVVEGKHPFCQRLVKAQKPLVILGSGVKKRLDSKAFSVLIEKLSKQTSIFNEDWLGVNFLPLEANTVGSNLLGISQKSSLKRMSSHWKFVYCVGLSSPEKFFINCANDFSKNTFFVVQTPHSFSSSLVNRKGLLLPSTTFIEKEGTFVNLEGRLQKTSIALVTSSLARDDSKILSALFSKVLKTEATFSSVKNCLSFNSNRNTFTKELLIRSPKKTPHKLLKTPLGPVVPNFFDTNIITKNSLIMTRCASMFKKTYRNFL